jgi:hypothetical protein
VDKYMTKDTCPGLFLLVRDKWTTLNFEPSYMVVVAVVRGGGEEGGAV